ncbi:MAG TPA: HAD family hydrolase [Ectothiorhodospiraceae bacterium]|nr:HAD family hydrolase [Ectothiorhodospiraceae bacterium]
MNQHRGHAILFDLDGTLVDTAQDLANALNYLLETEGERQLPFEQIRPHATHGTVALIKVGFDIDERDPRFQRFRQTILDRYLEHIADESVLFEGLEPLLEQLEHNGQPWGVVTNKPAFLTQPLLEQLNLWDRAAVVVSGDTLKQSKPDPAPLLYACEQIGSDPQASIYIGDAERDIRAGRAAGMHTITAHYGYIGQDEQPENWGADSEVTHASQLAPMIDKILNKIAAKSINHAHE